MSLKLSNRIAERSLIKLICAGQPVSRKVLAQVDESYFGNSYNRVAFRRIMTLTKKNNDIPSWRSISKYDTALPDNVRESLAAHKAKVNISKESVQELLGQLYNYRRRRLLDKTARYINEKQLEEGYDDQKLLEEVADFITQARHKRESHKPLKFGRQSNYKQILEKVLAGEALKVLPIGFSAWDDVNGGIVDKTVTLLQGFTGSMKSTLAEVIACNLADRGARVGQMSLEMSQEETLILRAARAARIDRSEILLARNLTPKQQDKIRRALQDRNRNWKKLNSCVETHTPPDGITASELFLSMESYDYDVLIVDYVSLIRELMSAPDFWRKLMEFTATAKTWASRTNTRVILLVQATEENRMKLSTNMANDADVVLAIEYDEDFADNDFMNIKTVKARKQKKVHFPLKKEGKYADIYDCTDEELKQYQHDREQGKIDVKEKKRKHIGDGVEKIETRGRKTSSDEQVELENYFAESALDGADID